MQTFSFARRFKGARHFSLPAVAALETFVGGHLTLRGLRKPQYVCTGRHFLYFHGFHTNVMSQRAKSDERLALCLLENICVYVYNIYIYIYSIHVQSDYHKILSCWSRSDPCSREQITEPKGAGETLRLSVHMIRWLWETEKFTEFCLRELIQISTEDESMFGNGNEKMIGGRNIAKSWLTKGVKNRNKCTENSLYRFQLL